MIKSLYLLIIAAVAIVSVSAADDVSVVGAHTTPLGPITPDVSVVGWQTGTVADVAPDVSVVGAWTATTTGNVATATQTECYRVVETGGFTSSVPAQATVIDGANPSGYQCYYVYTTGGGVLHVPLPSSAKAPTPNLAITIGLPIIISVIGLAAIIGAIFVLMRLRARRAAEGKRTWVDRPGGWANDAQAGKMESGAARY